jgi:uncharacterized protein YndB with AHSA1/START domain
MSEPVARASMMIAAAPERVFDALVEPDSLRRYWLAAASAPLRLGQPARWTFLVPGAEAETTATALDRPHRLAWDWSDGTTVEITIEAEGAETVVAVACSGFAGDAQARLATALATTEGFAIVLADLKTWLETGRPAGLTAAKARLITARGC